MIPIDFDLDFTARNSIKLRDKLRQNDINTYKFIVNLKQNGEIYNITKNNVDHLWIFFLKADSERVQGVMHIVDAEQGIVSYEVQSQEIACVGLVNAEIVAYGANGSKLTSAKFNFYVDEVINNDNAVESTSTYSSLETGLEELTEIIEEAKKEVDNVQLQQAVEDIKTLDKTKASKEELAATNAKIDIPDTIPFSTHGAAIASMNITGMLIKGLFRPCAEGVEPIIVDGKLITPALHYDLITVGKNKYDNSNKLLGTWVSIPTPPAQPYLSKDTLGKEHSVKFIAKPNTAYTIKTFNGTFSRNVIAWLDANKNIMKAETYTVNSQEITLVTSPPNTHEIIAYVSSVGLNEDAQVVVVEGDTIPTSYIPYDVSKTEFSTVRSMVKINGLYDEITKDGKSIYRNNIATINKSDFTFISAGSIGFYTITIDDMETVGYYALSNYRIDYAGTIEVVNDSHIYNNATDKLWSIHNSNRFFQISKTLYDNWVDGTKLYYNMASEDVIENGINGFDAPSFLEAVLNGDLIVKGMYKKAHTLNNSNTITLDNKVIDLDGAYMLVDGKYAKLQATLTDNTTVTLDSNKSGKILVKAELDPATYICPNITANIPINMSANMAAVNKGVVDNGGKILDIQDKINLIIAGA